MIWSVTLDRKDTGLRERVGRKRGRWTSERRGSSKAHHGSLGDVDVRSKLVDVPLEEERVPSRELVLISKKIFGFSFLGLQDQDAMHKTSATHLSTKSNHSS
jgi:hypothetical protein